MKTNFAVVVMLASIFLSVALVAHSATAKKRRHAGSAE